MLDQALGYDPDFIRADNASWLIEVEGIAYCAWHDAFQEVWSNLQLPDDYETRVDGSPTREEWARAVKEALLEERVSLHFSEKFLLDSFDSPEE